VASARACPPEDIGGMVGYEEFLEAINNPRHSAYQEYLEWFGDSFDPVAFDAGEVNGKLYRLK
jgi:hypothetical protein